MATNGDHQTPEMVNSLLGDTVHWWSYYFLLFSLFCRMTWSTSCVPTKTFGIWYSYQMYLKVHASIILIIFILSLDFLNVYTKSPEDISCLATPPLSPPDSEDSLPCCQATKLKPRVVATSNGGLVQVLKSGETVPIKATLPEVIIILFVCLFVYFYSYLMYHLLLQRDHAHWTMTRSIILIYFYFILFFCYLQPKVSKRELRLIKNRESASLSRQKKKEVKKE